MEFPLDLTTRKSCSESGGSSPTNSACSSESSGSQFFLPCRDRIDSKTDEDGITNYNGDVGVSLLDNQTWRAFHSKGTEMIINRNGRRMFPHVTVLPNGLSPSGLYNIWLEIQPADDRRYKYVHKEWVPISRADTSQVTQPYLHPDSPNTGAFWMQNKVSFDRLKLTNNRDSQDGNVLLRSMHKYRAEVSISEVGQELNSDPSEVMTFIFHETSFIAVTAYQNEFITKMKIHNNPFAKAFRDKNLSSKYAKENRLCNNESKSGDMGHSRKRKSSLMREEGSPIADYASESIHLARNPVTSYPASPWRYGNLPIINQGDTCRDGIPSFPFPMYSSHRLSPPSMADIWPVNPYLFAPPYPMGSTSFQTPPMYQSVLSAIHSTD